MKGGGCWSGPPKERTFEMGSQYQKKPAGGAQGHRGGECKGPGAGTRLVVSRHREKAGGLEGTEPGVKRRVGRWET